MTILGIISQILIRIDDAITSRLEEQRNNSARVKCLSLFGQDIHIIFGLEPQT